MMRYMNAICRKLADRSGQMTVELCAVLPVVIVIAAILVNAMTFSENAPSSIVLLVTAFDFVHRRFLKVRMHLLCQARSWR